MKTSILPILSTILAAAALLASAGEARALEISGAAVRVDGSLVVDFRDDVLPRGDAVRYTLTSKATTVFVCAYRSNPRNFVPFPRLAASLHVLKVITFEVDEEGNVEGTIVSDPPALPLLACPVGMAPVLASAHYEDILLVNRFGSAPAPMTSWEAFPLP
ncbi:hypothetical protein [Polyangium sp. 15x6]|uniref:hypothetical protein n=1 Tax=Polyangium sp. 15x6 TaxID=3042687 RepID=UPI002499BD3E|nr:hypothetical protein [Polyangium sp. 15x6]MDI3287494.1 hypothetical protein [Polyangium sp. 15x6]